MDPSGEPSNLRGEEALDKAVEQVTDEDRSLESLNTHENRVIEDGSVAPEEQREAELFAEGEALDETILASDDTELPDDQLVDSHQAELAASNSPLAELDPERPESIETDHETVQHHRTPTQYVHEVLDEHLGYIHDLEEYRISGNIGIGFDPENEAVSLRYEFDTTPDMDDLVFSKAEGLPETVRALLGTAENVELDVYQGENYLNIDMEWGQDSLEEGTYEALGHLLNVRDLHPIEYE